MILETLALDTGFTGDGHLMASNTRISHNHWAVIAISSAMALACGGCGAGGPQLAPVQGRVLLDGQPLNVGQVLTQPAAGRGANGSIQPDGTFELSSGREPGALIGTHRVAVVAYAGGASESPEASQGKLLIPRRYTSAETSGLTIEVASGENAPIIELTSAN